MKELPVLQPLCCGPGAPPLDPSAAGNLAELFKALADPTRVAIVNRLAAGEECCVCDMTDAFDAGLVEAERRGTWAYYRLVPDAIGRLREVFAAPALEPA
jgi:ArsR family transcriptional regulator